LASSLRTDVRRGGVGYRWRFADLLVARLFRDLREAGVPMQRIRRAAGYLYREGLNVQHLEPLGVDLVLWMGPTVGLSAAVTPGQTVSRTLVWDAPRVGVQMLEGIETERKRAA